MNKPNVKFMKNSSSVNLIAVVKKLKPANKANKTKSNSKDPIFVIDDDDEEENKNGETSDSPQVIQMISASPVNKTKPVKPAPVENSTNKKGPAVSSYIRKKKMRIENKEIPIISIDNPPPAVQEEKKEKKAEAESKSSKYTDLPQVYQTKFEGVEPLDYYLKNNPGKTKNDLDKLKSMYMTEVGIDRLAKDDQNSVLNMLKEFYEEKTEKYNLCTCQYCKMLNLPFLVRKDITDPEEINSLAQKHGEYCTKHFQETMANRKVNEHKDLYNIFFKKVYLGEVKCKNITGAPPEF